MDDFGRTKNFGRNGKNWGKFPTFLTDTLSDHSKFFFYFEKKFQFLVGEGHRSYIRIKDLWGGGFNPHPPPLVFITCSLSS